ncbi:MAG TPA: FAD-dependent oxidoreductase, partial [Propionibacteriaceae bacterium]|nr:FAD-dependent oxidoreductase [Propionibacteriaceae bacterium]
MTDVTVIGGGLGGLAAAITAAEGGASVTLHEAHRTLGGRWRSTPVRRKAAANPSEAPRAYRAHEGPHVIYRD